MIQAMIWAFVLTSGAGMSVSGPMRTAISVENRRVRPSSSFWRELLRVDDDAALAAAVRDADDRALPGHPHREGLDLVEGDVLVVADAALGRAAAEVVLDAVAGEHLDRAVVHVDREVDGQLAARLAQDPAQPWVEVEALGGQVELALRHFPGVDRRRGVLGGHGDGDLHVRARPRLGRPGFWVVSRTTPRARSPSRSPRCRGAARRSKCGRVSHRGCGSVAGRTDRSGGAGSPCCAGPGGPRRAAGQRRVQHDGADAARAEVRPDRRADELDR